MLKGIAVCSGYADGIAWACVPPVAETWSRASISPAEVDVELRRFNDSLAATAGELKRLRDRTSAEIGADQADIFNVQLAILGDAEFITKVEDHIKLNKVKAEHALICIVEDWIEESAALTDEYLREKAQDIQDLGQRLMSHLSGRSESHPVLPPEQSILVIGELSPSAVMELDRSRVIAVVTEWGGPTSHTSILLRSLGIPAVTGLTGIRDRIRQGQRVLVNGELGTVVIEPTEQEATLFRSQRACFEQTVSSLTEGEMESCMTLDGVQINLFANISRPGEVEDALKYHLEGVELLRTELLFLGSDEPPALVDQYEAYRAATEALAGRPLVIRTFDLGGDKIPRFLQTWALANPKLSLRGLRFSLKHKHLLRTQFLAILDVAQHYDVRVLLPMVMGTDDLCEAIDLLKDVAVANNRRIPLLGAMIETPSALFSLEEIMPHVDFLSLGTNDLAQLMLGTNRDATELSEEFAAVYPTILRAIRRVVETAEKARRPLTVCGEMAGHPTIAPLLVGLGIRRLSMTPSRCVQVRHALRRLSCRQAEEVALQALQCDSRHKVQQLLRRFD